MQNVIHYVKRKSFDLVVYDAQTAGMVILGLEGVGISNVTLWKTAYSQMKTYIHWCHDVNKRSDYSVCILMQFPRNYYLKEVGHMCYLDIYRHTLLPSKYTLKRDVFFFIPAVVGIKILIIVRHNR